MSPGASGPGTPKSLEKVSGTVRKKDFPFFPVGQPLPGRLTFIHHQCWEVLPFCRFQRQRCIKILCPKDPDFYTPLALKTAKGQHLPALVVYKNQSPTSRTVPKTRSLHVTFSLLERVDLRSQKEGILGKEIAWGRVGWTRQKTRKKGCAKKGGWMNALVRTSKGDVKFQWRGRGHSMNRRTLENVPFCAQPLP